MITLGEKVADYFLLNLSRALAGNLMKRFFFGLGSGNSGKSTLVKAYSSSFGKLIGIFNAEKYRIKIIQIQMKVLL